MFLLLQNKTKTKLGSTLVIEERKDKQNELRLIMKVINNIRIQNQKFLNGKSREKTLND